VIAKEPQHFLGCVRPSRIGVRPRGTAARPSVTSSMDAPLLQNCFPVRVSVDRARIGVAAGNLPATHLGLPAPGSRGLVDDVIGVSGVYDGVAIAVKDDGREGCLLSTNRRNIVGRGRVWRTAVPHRGECREKIVGGPTR
jgi:hypothetical protein